MAMFILIYLKVPIMTENMDRIIGYVLETANQQNLNEQVDVLVKAGCEKKNIFVDRVSGVTAERPGLNDCLNQLRAGDLLVVWQLDRLGRSISHLVRLIETLKDKQVGFRSICDVAIDTTTISGQLVFNIFSSIAKFEKLLIKERTHAGLYAARARGRMGGRPRISANHPRVVDAKKMYQDKNFSIDDICNALKISRSSLYRYLAM